MTDRKSLAAELDRLANCEGAIKGGSERAAETMRQAAKCLRAQPPAREDGAEKYAEILRTVCHHLELPQSESGPADDVTLYDRALEGLIAELRKTEAQRVEHQKARHIAEAALQAREDAQPVAWKATIAPETDPDWPEAREMGSKVFCVTRPDGQRHSVIAVDANDAVMTIRELHPYTHPAPDALRVAVEQTPGKAWIDCVQKMLDRFDRAKGKGGYPTANEREAMRRCMIPVHLLAVLQAGQGAKR